jgi:arsenite methyltransferase
VPARPAPDKPSARPDYGIDAPPIVASLLASGVVCLVLACFRFGKLTIGSITILLTPSLWSIGISATIGGLLMIVYAKWWKFRHAERMMVLVPWRGDEKVLDVGTGRGLLLIAAARRLSTGRAVGIDIWSAKDLSGNAPQNTLRNAELEGVRERVEVQTGDATTLTFADGTFDVVLSNLCIHNIPSRAGRKNACKEVVRVLKPGGRAVISDYVHTRAYASWFRAAGAKTKRSFYLSMPPLSVVEVQKP